MKLGIISDEISQDPDHAFRVAKRLGATFVELRDVRGQNVCALSNTEVLELRRLSTKYGLEISNIDSYAFKVHIDDEEGYKSSLSSLRRAIELSKLLDISFTRIFTFWWREGLETHLKRLSELLGPALDLASTEGVVLAVENEYSCLVGSGRETKTLLDRVGSRWLRVLWDPGNAFFARENPYPQGFNHVKDMIVHVHLKDAAVENGTFKFKPIGKGMIDYISHLRELSSSFDGVLSLETHYSPPRGTKEDGTIESFNGLLQLLSRLKLV